ncbi:diguanylate cyclase [Aeromonas jandaei]|uniref:sensor domain-containing diguanylate cyclase n=1 Tax=Aeromonas jandaei TaxID=650 RepID=UPI000F531D70|nr:sensor domain-containing diguanylate cyclase [Aeromonas jandaei]RQM71102.1 diguanylate cyclase [Aeromonas jandaei]
MSDKTQWRTWSLISRMRLGLVLLFFPILILGAIYYYHMTDTLKHDLQQQLASNNDQLHNILIKPYLDTLTTQFETIYSKVDYKDFLDKKIQHQSEYLQDWRRYQETTDLQYIYIGTEQKKLLVYPEWQPDSNFNPRTRPWYQLAVKHQGKMVWTEPYYDYIYGTLSLSLVKTIEDPTGKLIGVFSIDTLLHPISKWLNYKQDAGYQMLISETGKMLVHPDKELIFTPMKDNTWLSRFTGNKGVFHDKEKGIFVAYHKVDGQSWFLVSVIPESTIQGAIESVSLNVKGIIALTCILYLLLALSWAKYFQRMLNELYKLIKSSRVDTVNKPRKRMIELSRVYDEVEKSTSELSEARLLANYDQLTGLYNRRFFDRKIDELLESEVYFFLAIVDLDNFKAVNDTYGHQVGDSVLKRIAKLGNSIFHEHGWFCRYGGEELAVILEVRSSHLAAALLEDLRHGVESLDWREEGLHVTLSGGISTNIKDMKSKDIIKVADELVYKAKKEGKNKVCCI